MGRTDSSRRIRVLGMVDAIGIGGGAEATAREIAIGLDPARFESHFCVTRFTPRPEFEPALAQLRDANVSFHGVERGSRIDIGAWRGLLRQLREWEIDILHSHKLGSNFWASLLVPRAGVPLFVPQDHTWEYEGQPIRRLVDRRLIAARSAAFVASSNLDRERMISVEHIPREKTRVVLPGIEDRDRTGVPIELEDLGEGPVIGAVAVLRRQKALDVLIRAAGVLSEEFPGLRVLIAGGDDGHEPDERARLQGVVAELGIGRNVRFLGHRSDVDDVLATLSVGVLSSDFEGSPKSVIEYMAAGLPVVATRVGGLPDIVDDGVTGALVAPGDWRQLAGALATLLRDPERRMSMGRAGRARQQAEYTNEVSVAKMMALYEELWSSYRQAGS